LAEKEMTLHHLISKQLKRANLEENDIHPDKRLEWNDFLSRISRTYSDQEQERYLLERSMEISSREMLDLNEKLEYAQMVAHLGYWIYDRVENKLLWSKETFNLAGIDPSQGTPALDEAMQLVHEEDRPRLEFLMQRAFEKGESYELELRFKNKKDNQYYWLYAKGHPHVKATMNASIDKNDTGAIRYLSGIAIDITERKLAEENLKAMHQQLLSISRQAGMAEVATSVLHNIGNILNSANVSISLLQEMLEKSRVTKLNKISEMIKEHLSKSDNYFTEDENGKLIPDYLLALSKDISAEHSKIFHEINNINTHLEHIKDVVSLQKDISGIAGVKEEIDLQEVVDLAVQMGCAAKCNEVEIVKDYQYDDCIETEKSKLLQILVNLVRNAKDSVSELVNQPKKIIVTIKKADKKPFVIITVTDNGGGIAHENLTRIFSLGFTTKAHGHGFGLHSSAIAANELGGVLNAASEGIGRGASFTIELPLVHEQVTNEVFQGD